MVVPAPSRLSACTVPPWPSTMCFGRVGRRSARVADEKCRARCAIPPPSVPYLPKRWLHLTHSACFVLLEGA